MAAGQLAPTLFSTGPQDKLVTSDIYGVVSGNPVNNVETSLASGLGALLQGIRSSGGTLGALASLVSVGPAGISLNASALISRVTAAIVQSGGSPNQLTPALQTQVLQQAGFNSNQYPSVATNIGGVQGSPSTSNIGGIGNLIGIVNSITGNSSLASIIDVGAASALMAVVMNEAITAGVPGAVQALVSNSTNSVVAANALKANTAYAIQQSDMATLSTILATVGPGYVASQVPNAGQSLLSNYVFPANTTAAQYSSLYTALITSMNTIQPGWDVYNRNGVEVSNLKAFGSMSANAKTLFAAQDAYTLEIAIAPNYLSQDIVAMAKQQYPYMVVIPAATQVVVTSPLTQAA
jgi:hypothetical protein